MHLSDAERTVSELHEIGQKTAAALAERERTYRLWMRSRADLTETIRGFVGRVHALDVSRLREDQFPIATNVIAQVIEALEKFLVEHVASRDAAQLHFMGETIRDLKDAGCWIAQGLSPDPSKRPSSEERERLTADAADRALRTLLKDA